MKEKRTFAVAALGIPETECHILRNIFRLSEYRTRSYTLTGFQEGPAPEIVLVNGDQPAALEQWRREIGQRPTVLVYREPPADAHPYHVRRPFLATRVLSVLDQVAIQSLSYLPEVSIGGEAAPDLPTTRTLEQTVQQAPEPESRFVALVVDDSLPVRKQIELELRMMGGRADFAETGERALALLESHSYDLIFLDVILPGVDGYRICKLIKKHKEQRRTPVIMLTGKSGTFNRVRGALAGCDTYLTKPVAHDAFQKVIRQYLS